MSYDIDENATGGGIREYLLGRAALKPSFRLLFALATGLLLLPQGGTAQAVGVCERLQSRLASLPRVAADTPNVLRNNSEITRRYGGAITRQNMELRKANGDLRRLGCSSGSITIVGGPNAAACGELASAIDRMERNLQILNKKRREFSSAGGNAGARRRILAALERNGCNEGNAAVLPAATSGTTDVIEDMRPSGIPLDIEAGGTSITRLGPPTGTASSPGGLRTVCVRTCDGGFFPISSGATPLDFRRDQKVCAMMCPQVETELFYHPLFEEDTGRMVSAVTGRPYSMLPQAFAYRARDRSSSGTCGCDLSAYYREMIKREKALGEKQEPGASEDGIGSGGGGSVTTIRTMPEEKHEPPPRKIEERAYDPANSNVRSVGPAFLPESATDLQRPAASGAN